MVDGVLTGEELASAHAHLDVCPQCKGQYEAILSLKRCLGQLPEPADCQKPWKACIDRLNEIDKAKRIDGFIGKYAWGICGAFLALIVLAGVHNRALGPSNVSAGQVAQMASSLMPVSSSRVSNPNSIQQFMNESVGNAPLAYNTSQPRAVSGARGVFDGHPIVQLRFVDDKGSFVILVIGGTDGLEGFDPISVGNRYQGSQMASVNCIGWADRGFALFVMGDRSLADLCKIAESVRIRE